MNRTKPIKLYLLMTTRIEKSSAIISQEPLSLLTLATALKSKKLDIEVYSGNIYNALLFLEKHAEMDKNRTIILGLYCDYENITAVTGLATQVKKQYSDYRIVVGGPQVIGLGKDFLINTDVDILIRGDGEHAMAEFVDCLERWDKESILKIPGLCTMDSEKKYIDNGVAESIEDLNAMPVVDGSIKTATKYDVRYMAVLSGRGCPFHCSFCYEGGNSKKVRFRSVEHLMREIYLRLEKNEEIKYIYFGDDTFTLNMTRMVSFCEAFKELRRTWNVVWFADAHVKMILKHPELVRMMVDAGMVRMQIGIESCCQEIIDIYNKGIRKEDFYTVVRICQEAGLPQLAGNIIIGGAKETHKTIKETFETIYDLLKLSKGMLDVTSTLYSNFPNTPMSAEPEKFGLYIEDLENITSFADFPIASTEELSREEIAAYRKEFMQGTIRTMKICFEENLVDEAQIQRNCLLSNRYGITNLWQNFVLYEGSRERQFYNAVVNYGKNIKKINHEEMLNMIPVRCRCLSLENKITNKLPQIGKYILTPIEYDIYHFAAGKLTVRELCSHLYEKWGNTFGSMEKFENFIIALLERFEQKRLLVFSSINAEGSEQALDPIKKRLDAGCNKKVLLFYPYMITKDGTSIEAGKNLGIYYLAAQIKQRGYQPVTCECAFSDVTTYLQQENDGNLYAVGLSVDYENIHLVKKIARLIKDKFKVPVIVGGVESYSIDKEFLQESMVDLAVKGEAEIILPEVLDNLKYPEKLKKIGGLLFLENNEMIDTGEGRYVLNLTTLPFPDYDSSIRPLDKRDFFYVMTGRGCPYTCAFCHEGGHKTKLRMRSIEDVLEEIQSILERFPNCKYIVFCDDTFVLNKERVLTFCIGLKKLREKWDFMWYCEADVFSLDRHPEILPVMVEAGLLRLQIGIESGDDKILKIYQKNLTTEMVKRVVKIAYDAGVSQMPGPLLIGAPFENKAHIEREKEYAEELIRLAPGMIEIPPAIIIPYGQTKIGKYPEKYGYQMTDPHSFGSNSDYPAYGSEKMSERDILEGYQMLVEHILEISKKVIHEGRISDARKKMIVENALLKRGGFYWNNIIENYFPMQAVYFQILIQCRVCPMRELEKKVLLEWHPQRTFEMWRSVDFSGDAPRIGIDVLSPYEYEIILHSAGKLSISQIAEKLYTTFGQSAQQSLAVFTERVADTILKLEKKYWLVGVPY